MSFKRHILGRKLRQLTSVVAVAVLMLLGDLACQSGPPQLSAPRWIEITASANSDHQYFVSPTGDDANDGSSARPWKTIQRAGKSAKPGSTIHVAPGEYVTEERTRTEASGSAEKRIRYVSDQKRGARLVSHEAGKWGMVWQNAGDYVDIEGFDVTGTGAWGIVNGGSHVRVMNNRVHNIPAEGCPGTGGAGVAHSNYKSVDNDTIGNEIHDIGNSSIQCSTVHGIYHMNPGGRILNNIVYRNWGWGIHTYHAATDLIISNNTVFANTYGGIVISAAAEDFRDGRRFHDHTLVSNNIVYRNGQVAGAKGYGIEEFGSAVGSGNTYVSNLVYDNGPANWRLKTKSNFDPIDADPKFLSYTGDSTGDYRLADRSPAKRAGTAYGAPSVDIAGRRRSGFAKPDLGAYQTSSN